MKNAYFAVFLRHSKTKRRSNVIVDRYGDIPRTGYPSGKIPEGASIIVKIDKNEIRQFLLGRLPEAEEEQFELRLLSDPAFGEEFDTIVDEITDDYLQQELPDDERERVEKYFLSTTERQTKLNFAAELLRRAESERARQVKEVRSNLFERLAALWRQQSFARAVMTAASVVVVVGIIYVVFRPDNTNYIPLSLTINTAERNEGAAAVPVKLPANTGLKLTLTIPEDARGAKSYVARLSSGTDLKTELTTPATVTVIIPPGSLPPGTYAIQLSKISPDGRISGSYYFAIE